MFSIHNKGRQMSELDPNNVQDGITMWQLGGGTFLGLLGVIAA